jgi:hypothetical protein
VSGLNLADEIVDEWKIPVIEYQLDRTTRDESSFGQFDVVRHHHVQALDNVSSVYVSDEILNARCGGAGCCFGDTRHPSRGEEGTCLLKSKFGTAYPMREPLIHAKESTGRATSAITIDPWHVDLVKVQCCGTG